MKRLVVFFSIALVAMASLTQLDDELTPEAKQLLLQQQNRPSSEAYYYALGFSAQAGNDPKTVGEQRFLALSQATAEELVNSAQPPLLLPEGEPFCRFSQPQCLEYLLTHDNNDLLTQHSLLINRFRHFLTFNEYSTQTLPDAVEEFVPYRYLNHAARLALIEAISAYQQGAVMVAEDKLTQQFRQIRRAMALQDTVIGKMLMLSWLNDILDLHSVILAQSGRRSDRLSRLTQSEKSFSDIIAREFMLSYRLFRQLDKRPDFFDEQGELPGWLVRVVFKPNMSVNAITPGLYRLQRLSLLSATEFATAVRHEPPGKARSSMLRNYAGHVLVGISADFEQYLARLHDFDVKLMMFNQLYHWQQSADALTHPYFNKQQLRQTETSLCFPSVIENNRQRPCLILALKPAAE